MISWIKGIFTDAHSLVEWLRVIGLSLIAAVAVTVGVLFSALLFRKARVNLKRSSEIMEQYRAAKDRDYEHSLVDLAAAQVLAREQRERIQTLIRENGKLQEERLEDRVRLADLEVELIQLRAGRRH